jgi:hypothetical protein
MNDAVLSATDTQKLKLIAFAIVVYKELFYKTTAFLTLQKSLSQLPNGGERLILVYDNTDTSGWKIDDEQIKSSELFYYHNPINPGISTAYNFLSRAAQQNGYEWILFMDQDTALPETAIAEYISAIKQRPDIMIKVPVIKANGKIYSPIRYVFKRGRVPKSVTTGVKKLENYVFINSGFAIKLSLFFEAGGYDENIKLDFADFLFLDKVRKKTDQFEVLPVWPVQSFSFLEYDITKALKRYEIFVKDLAKCPRTGLIDTLAYSSLGWSHMFKLSVKYKSLKFAKIWWANR